MKRRTAVVVVAAVVALAAAGVITWILLARGGDDARIASGHATEEARSLTGPEVLERAQQRLDEHLEECTEPAAEVPASCGIAIPWAADFVSVTGIRYRIEQSPALTLTPPTFRADGGILVATVTGAGVDGATTTLTYRTENWMLRGDVDVTATDVTLSPW